MSNQFLYGGQAVVEGVMIRGRKFLAVAVRRPTGVIATIKEPIHPFYSGRMRKIFLARGILVLAETILLGIKALNHSANLILEEEATGSTSRWVLGLTLVAAFGFGVTLFFLLPLFLVGLMDSLFPSTVLRNLAEGAIRLCLFIVYIKGIGLMPDMRRVFAYHGAEHMAVHAHEAGEPLTIERVRDFPKAHPRCGTALLLVVMVTATIVFVFLGKPPMIWQILSRLVLIPFIAAISYELIRYSGTHAGNPLIQKLMAPNLWLQTLTTRQPSDSEVEVAVTALKLAIAADEEQVGAGT